MKNYQCVIIGAGVAGMTAAIYLQRMNINILLLEQETPGGQIINSPLIENYPGFTKISGAQLAINIQEQIKTLEIPCKYGKVINISKDANKKIITTDQEKITCEFVILATGRKPKKLNITNEDKLLGHGISYCAICDGAFYKGKDVTIVGGGNSALEESLFLSKICKSVTIVNRSNQLKGESILIKRINESNNIKIKNNSIIKKIVDKNNRLYYIELDNTEKIYTSGLFICIGLIPDIQYTENLKISAKNKYILVNKNMQTNIEHIYACGDIISKDIYQIVTATGEAAIAAINIAKRIQKKE
ncbi:MAG: FAD-dependent oxidoreductase [Bacilli bacterium]